MEDWEKELREKLNKELLEGSYQIGDPTSGFIAFTGKQGKINFEVELTRYIKNTITCKEEL